MHITQLPSFSPLFKDYVAKFSTTPVHEFFRMSPEASPESVEQWLAESLSSADRGQTRKAVQTSIERLNGSLGISSEKISKHLKDLADPKTFAIVTGQQVGVLGGPLYSFYKAFTAIELAKRFSEQYPEYRFVPIFWLETEDHDLDEATSVHVLDKDSGIATIRYTPTGAGDDQTWRKQIGPLPLEEEPLTAFFGQLSGSLGHTEFTDSLMAELRSIYAPGHTFAEAFAQLLFRYFGEEGLLIIDANDPDLKRSAKELFRKEIETSPQLSEKIVLQSVKLEEHYHAQVKPRALNLFMIENGERLPIVEHEPSPHSEGRTFFLRGTRRTFTLEELLKLCDESPERFSPNVVLRPLYQDTLLPTAVYVGGPGEIAYFAQFAPAYEWAGIPMPIIAPRLSATIIEERLERILEKYELKAEQVLTEGRTLEEQILSGLIDERLEQAFLQAAAETEEALERLREAVKQTDPTLDASLTTVKGKVATTVRDFGNKVLAADRKRHSTARQQLDRLFAALLPEDQLQERELSMIYFLNKYGPGFLDRLKSMLSPLIEQQAEHHVLHLAGEATAARAEVSEAAAA